MAVSRIYLDTNIVIAIIEGSDGLTATQRDVIVTIDSDKAKAVTSEFTLAECLVKPLQDKNVAAVKIYMNFFDAKPHLDVMPVKRDVLLAASRICAEFRMKMPDAIHVATAMSAKCNMFLTNDLRMKVPAGLTLRLWSQLA